MRAALGRADQNPRRLIDAPAARVPAGSRGLRTFQVRGPEIQVRLAELSRDQTERYVNIAVPRLAAELGDLPIEPSARRLWRLPVQPPNQQIPRRHGVLLKATWAAA